ncbi:MAG: hypothetical protein Fur0041_04920 [Bacteroidia bacterium]
MFSSFVNEHKAYISFQPMIGNALLNQDKKYFIAELNDSIQIDVLSFYISDITFLRNDTVVFREDNSYHLIDFTKPVSMRVAVDFGSDITYDKVRFHLGVDSLTNVSGAMGGDLDPVNGMYWTWQSGYINFKMEGVSQKCPARNNRFQYHLGGYQFPFNTLQKIELKTVKKVIQVDVHPELFFKKVDVSKEFQIMSPSQKAVQLSETAASLFSVHS